MSLIHDVHLDTKTKTTVIVLLLASLGVWIGAAPHWADLLTTSAIGGLFGQLALILGAALGVRPGLKADRGTEELDPDLPNTTPTTGQ